RGENDLLLQFGGKRTDHVQTRGRQYVYKKHSKLGVAVRNRLHYVSGRGLRLDFCFHCLADAETFKHPEDLSTSRARRYGRNRLRLEQRLLDGVGRAYLRFGSARADGNAQAYASDVGCRPGNELSLSGGVLEH